MAKAKTVQGRYRLCLRHLQNSRAYKLACRIPRGNERGVALLIALFAMMMMISIAVEVTFDTSVDYAASSQAVNRLKAYYGARGAMELSLLRVKLYRKISSQLSGQSGGGAIPMQMIDQIWQLPFVWPFPMPETISQVEKEQLQKAMKLSTLDAQYAVRIESEGNKLDLNDLASSSEGLRNATRSQLLKIFQNQVETDEKFQERYRNFDFIKLVGYITDWVSDAKQSAVGGDKTSPYFDIATNNHFIPPSQPFKSLDELHMVATMTDDLYNLLEPRVTVFGTKGINVNYAKKETLMSLDPRITDQVVAQIEKYKTDFGLFKGKDDFFSFLKGQGVDTRNLDGAGAVPLFFDAETNFRITSTATFGKASREIIAITYDFDKVKSRLVDALKADDKTQPDTAQPKAGQTANTANPAPAPTATPTQTTVAKGRPNIVYWHED